MHGRPPSFGRHDHERPVSRLDTVFSQPQPCTVERPRVSGKFFFVGADKYWVRGTTYGPFKPDVTGSDYGNQAAVERDFAQMAANGFNTVRVYTVPPLWLLDTAQRHGLRVMVGLPWEQHVTFLDDRSVSQSIEQRVRDGVRACQRHPAVFCYAVGNEIPASIVRWHGAPRIERFIRRLYKAVKAEDPAALVTYVNFPTTEYLNLQFLDFLAVNVYLEREAQLRPYLARLQNIAGSKPLLMAEVGLDSRRNGVRKQADILSWQIRSAFAAGCSGVVLFAWTDAWYRGGFEIEDWDFGITTRAREPKPALAAAATAFAQAPFHRARPWPRISVVVCSYNGAATIRDTLRGLELLDYPNFEVIVVDDGSTDATPRIAAQFPYRVISTPNKGLSNARNIGWQLAEGEIVAYIDDDAYPDPDWLSYLAVAFETSDCVGIGGPNIVPQSDRFFAQCVAHAPGNPQHILLTDSVAEHIPGCNMAFRRDALAAVGGFDPRFRVAGDDVDLCWRLQQRGWEIGFSPAALVWHHRRSSLSAYWRQQLGYGRAESLLEKKWPEKYNRAGHVNWAGRLYGDGLMRAPWLGQQRVYHGKWGTAPFQSVYEPRPGMWLSLTLTPEWYLLLAGLGVISAIGAVVPLVLVVSVPLMLLVAAVSIAKSAHSALRSPLVRDQALSASRRRRAFALITILHLLQPLARLIGRQQQGLTPWRRRPSGRRVLPLQRHESIWSEDWKDATERLTAFVAVLRDRGLVARTGDDFARHDLEIPGGCFAAARLLMAIEEHGAGRQLIRFRVWPHINRFGCIGLAGFLGAAALGAIMGSMEAVVVGGITALAGAGWMVQEAAAACGAAWGAILEHKAGSGIDRPSPDEPYLSADSLSIEAVPMVPSLAVEEGPRAK